ncbi:MAG: NRDE family protein, partial [Kiloniellales bacterium]
PGAAMTVAMPERGYGTVCSSLIALPAPSIDPDRPKPAPVFLFCPEPPRRGRFQPVALAGS